jgi:hypothetical protein
LTKSSLTRELVIKGYFEGKSFDEISEENSISKGSVFNIMKSWISQTGIPDIKELREFSKIIRNSGITVKQCAQSFRFIQILHKFGINDEIDLKYIESTKPTAQRENKSDFVKVNNNKTVGIKKDYSSNPRNIFYYFI